MTNTNIYVIGLIMFGIAVANMEQYEPVHGFLIIGSGLMVLGIVGMITSYLDGGSKFQDVDRECRGEQ